MDQASLGTSEVTEPNEIKSLILQIPSDICTKDTGPAQPILSSYPKAMLEINLNIGSVGVFRMVRMIFKLYTHS